MNKDFYKNALEYVNKNGVHIYGVLVEGNVNDILEFEKQDNICNMSPINAKLAVFSD